MSREQGDTEIDFGEHQEINSWRWEKRVKFQRETGAGDPPPLPGLMKSSHSSNRDRGSCGRGVKGHTVVKGIEGHAVEGSKVTQQ